jgi:DNA helicase-2/ATP-dependent DNA helicase PcrA
MKFDEVYSSLNPQQRQAVDTIDGPLLVIAGPGTGKTQLLSARVANILARTDTLPQNILCLTFTESGAQNMRDRLSGFIGQAAHDVSISTYHAFGGNLIQRFPEYFAATREQNPVDELGQHQILTAIVESLSYDNPLKSTAHNLGDLISSISEVKRALLSTETLRAIAAANISFITDATRDIQAVYESFTTMPRSVDKALPYFEPLMERLEKHVGSVVPGSHILPLGKMALDELRQAIESATDGSKTTPLTAWKNRWLAKDGDNRFIMSGERENRRLQALADVFEHYETALAQRGLYDFDDMILRAIAALEQHADLKYSLQEQYLYLLLDEFQDTNPAQLRLIQLLSDNPVHEGRPNILAVGDDDQAIYAFQGAQYSNMLDFYRSYRDVTLIHLVDNYRSHSAILDTARAVAEQIDSRLGMHFPEMDKTLRASASQLPERANIVRQELTSDLGQYQWITNRIAQLISSGVRSSEIAVLAPKHRYLEPLVAYLNTQNIPVRYEKRENILEAPLILELLAMTRLTLALSTGDETVAGSLWPVVLSAECWGVPVSTVWQLSWHVNDRPGELSWSQAVLASDVTRHISLYFMALAGKARSATVERMLDYLIGTCRLATREPDLPYVTSPLRAYYLSEQVMVQQPTLFYEVVSHLSVLRAKLREYQASQEDALLLGDLLDFVELYRSSGTRMVNTSPYNQRSDAVQLMTVFKAKGLEFEHVFLPSVQDEVWGESSRGSLNKLTLPTNLAPIRHAGATSDERLRIFYVALTRAKQGLYLTSFASSFSGKATARLKYLDEREDEGGIRRSMILPAPYQTVQLTDDDQAPSLQVLETSWQDVHLAALDQAKLSDLLRERLERYQLSPTHLSTFTDMEYGGPRKFFFRTLLRFPEAPSISVQFGNAIHETLEQVQQVLDRTGSLPTPQKAIAYFEARMRAKKLGSEETDRLIDRGGRALQAYLPAKAGQFQPGADVEHSFRGEGVFVGDTHLSGKIDRLEIDKEAKTITIVDFKTGKSFDRWESNLKLHKYRQQLYCYKLLVERSHTYAGYKVGQGRVEFVEPDEQGSLHSLILNYEEPELQRIQKLLNSMWWHVQQLSFPDVSDYAPTLLGTKAFEQWLVEHGAGEGE